MSSLLFLSLSVQFIFCCFDKFNISYIFALPCSATTFSFGHLSGLSYCRRWGAWRRGERDG